MKGDLVGLITRLPYQATPHRDYLSKSPIVTITVIIITNHISNEPIIFKRSITLARLFRKLHSLHLER